MKFKQSIALLCILILSLSLMCSCGNKSEKDSNNTTTKTAIKQTENSEKSDNSEEPSPIVLDKYKQKLTCNNTGSTASVNDYNFASAYASEDKSTSSNEAPSTNRPTYSKDLNKDYAVVKESYNPAPGISYKPDYTHQSIKNHEHTYDGGVCTICGKADKSKPYLALSTLIKKYGKEFDKNDYAVITKSKDITFFIAYDAETDENYLMSIEQISEGKYKSVVLCLPNPNYTSEFDIVYMGENKDMYGCCLNAKDFTTKTQIPLEDEEENLVNDVEVQTYTQDTCTVLMSFLNYFFEKTNCGLTLQDFGFASYVTYGG